MIEVWIFDHQIDPEFFSAAAKKNHGREVFRVIFRKSLNSQNQAIALSPKQRNPSSFMWNRFKKGWIGWLHHILFSSKKSPYWYCLISSNQLHIPNSDLILRWLAWWDDTVDSEIQLAWHGEYHIGIHCNSKKYNIWLKKNFSLQLYSHAKHNQWNHVKSPKKTL